MKIKLGEPSTDIDYIKLNSTPMNVNDHQTVQGVPKGSTIFYDNKSRYIYVVGPEDFLRIQAFSSNPDGSFGDKVYEWSFYKSKWVRIF